ncbi:hypothetical protein GP486_007839 [Trichoglossum hirsutum]|uniref:Uncharacterized protein n=1 Tax=Trichoglossum hirsutum TaxID=265104 RepID=A0A9P8L6L7_9PEZI|nr:hypothetical protein GP486_007839 [Trichoglossum hirsutum]
MGSGGLFGFTADISSDLTLRRGGKPALSLARRFHLRSASWHISRADEMLSRYGQYLLNTSQSQGSLLLVTLIRRERPKPLDRLMDDDINDNPSIPLQGKQPVLTAERLDEGMSTMGTDDRSTLQGYLSILFGLSVYGASVFSSLTSQLTEPTKFSLSTVRTFMAISWLFCLASMGSAYTSYVLIGPVAWSRGLATAMNRSGWDSNLMTRVGIFFMNFTIFFLILAVLFMALVVMAYAEAAGWVAVGLLSVATIFDLFMWGFIIM